MTILQSPNATTLLRVSGTPASILARRCLIRPQAGHRWPVARQSRTRAPWMLSSTRSASAMATGSNASDRPPLKKRSVVSSFLYKFVEENGQRKAKVALFKRSGQVRTYPHRWAVVSGSIDPEDASPQAAAWREIQEETTLTPSSLELMRQGKSYVLPDESIGREWTIYPFAFRLKEATEGGRGESSIALDWEHEEWKWYDPMEIEDSESFGAVPRLAESLRRVWFEKDLGVEAGAVLTNGLDRLKNDHQSGARQLAGVALQILREIIQKMELDQPTDQWWTKVRFASWHIWRNGREAMGAAVLSVLLAALRSMEALVKQNSPSGGSAASAKLKEAVLNELDRRIAEREDASNATSASFANFLQDRFASRVESKQPIKILTISESSTIAHALRHVITNTRFVIDLRILESRPLFEGVSLANSLLESVPTCEASGAKGASRDAAAPQTNGSKLRLTLYTDASAAQASHDVDVVLIGADRIAESGAVSNKTGSLPAVLSSKHVSAKAKTVIISESEKVAPPGAEAAHVVENNDPTQLVRAWKAEFNQERIKAAAGTVSSSLGGGNRSAPVRSGDQCASDDTAVHVDIRNVFFEWVPPELVDVYVTEKGVWSVVDIRRLSETLGKEVESLFADI